ncbi:MAG TPA: glycosyltransferase family A protein [Gemmataceae bacterium]|nr:glycosyltransferase family A protein [Gemmataceae bacterium]
MTRPLVSAIIPVYNGEKYLRKSIESVLAQSYDPIELIVVDDGSSDGSAELASSCDWGLRLIRQPNGGVAAARNTGIGAAHGDLIAFLDQDDWWLPQKVDRQVECFRADASLGLVHTATVHYDDTRSALAGSSGPATSYLMGRCYDLLLLRNGIYNSSVMVSRKALDAVGLLDTAIEGNTVQDYDLWLRIAKAFPLGFVPEPLTVWRLHPGQGYWSRRRMLTEELRLLERIMEEHALPPSAAMRRRLATLLGELGEAHLEASDGRSARRYFARALQTSWSKRHAIFYALSFLPWGAVAWLRQCRARLRGLTGEEPAQGLPAWTGGPTRSADKPTWARAG